MPNDPRVKFKKKIHDLCGNYVHFRASGYGGGVFGGSNFPTPPGPGPDPDPDPGPPGPGPGPGPGPPAPIKPGLDPGGIAGITIASAIAMAAAAALAEQERRRRANRGIPVPTDDIEMTNTRRSRPNLNRGGANPSRQTTPRINRSTGGYALLTDNTTGPRGVPTPFTQAGWTGSGDLRTSAPGTRTPAPLGSGASTPYFDAQSAPSPGFDFASITPAPVASGTATPKIPPPPGTRTSGTATPYFDAQAQSPGFDFASITPQPPAPAPPAPAPDPTPIDAQREFLNKQISKEKPFFREGQKFTLETKDKKIRTREFIDFDESILEDVNEVVESHSEKITRLEERQAKAKINLKNEPKGPGRTQAKQRLTQIEGELNYERTINPNLEGNSRLINEALSRRNLISGPKTRGQINREATFSYTASSPETGIPRTLNPTQPVGNSSANDALNASRPTSNVEMQDLTPQAHAQQTQAAAEAMLADLDVLTQTPDPVAVAERNRIISPGGSMEDLALEINELKQKMKGPGLFEKTMAAVNERFQRGKVGASGTVQDLQKMGSRNKIPTVSGSRTPLSGQATLERIRATGGRMPMPDAGTEMRGSSLRTPIAPAPAPAPAERTPAPAPTERTPAPAPAPSRAPIKLKDFLAKLGLSELMPILQTEGFDSVHAIGNYDINEANEMREALINRGVSENDINRILEEAKGAPFGAETQPRPTYEDRDFIQPRRPAVSEREAAGVGIDFSAEPRPPPAPAPPAERPPPRPIPEELQGTELQDAAGLTFRDRPVDRAERRASALERLSQRSQEIRSGQEEINRSLETQRETQTAPATPAQELNEHLKHLEDFHRSVVESYAKEGRPLPDTSQMSLGEWAEKTYVVKQALKDPANANRTITLESGQEITMEEALGDLMARNKEIKRLTKKLELSPDSELKAVSKAMAESQAPNKSRFGAKKGPKPEQARKLTKKTGMLATEEQRMRPTTFAGEAQSRVTAGTSTEARTARAPAPAPAQAPAPETRTPTGVREQVQALEARSARAPELRAGVPELRAVRAPPGSVPPSAPPSAPESEVATPRESAVREQTPAERAAFAEELTGRLKGPARQKAKINIGKTNPNVRNPLDIFVSPQHRNMPNTELNPRAKGFKGTLTEISARVPRLVPSRSTLISMGAEGGSMVGGFAAGYFSAQAMNDYFAKHPAKNFGEQYGQALATAFVGMAVGSLTQQVLSAVIRRGVNYALTGEMAAIEGAISGGGTAFLTSIGEAALFTAVAVTTQMATTKFLEDAGFNHAISRSVGAAVSTYALAETEYYLWAAKGGPVNLAADASLIVSEAMIIGFGIYQTITEYIEGDKEDKNEAEYQAQVAENKRLNEERQRTIDNTNRRNMARIAFMEAYEQADYDFDKALALLTPEQRADLGENADPKDPNGITAFRAQVEAAFDPLLDTTIPEGYKPDPKPLTGEEKLKRDTYNEYITWYIDSVNGKNPKPFDINSEGAQLLNRDTGGTWMSAANVHATTSMTMARRTNPLIQEAQEKIVDAFHKDHKTIEEMPYDIVQYAELDPGFRDRYNVYIISEAQTYIYQQYHSGGFTYNDLDPALVAIANRDPEFRGAVDTYYQVLANQARDYGLTIQQCAELNALATTDQQIEIGKLNETRNKIIQAHQAANQEVVDRYNANIIQEISAYGDNFEAIIRNINDQALLSGHTFLYAANRSDLYRQLHMEMPELELVDPDTGEGGEGGTDEPDAPLPGPGKGRKIGDTDLYGYRYKLTDEQNQELDEQARIGVFADNETQMAAAAAIIYERDRYLFEETDAEKAARENLTLDEYYEKYGIPVEPPIIEWERSRGNPKEDGKYRFPDGSIETWRNGIRVKVDTTNVVAPPAITKYDPSLPKQPDGQIEMPDGSVRTYSNGLVTSVKYPANTTAAEMLTPDQINAKEQPNTELTYEQLQQQYPETYKNLLRKYGDDPTGPAQIEAALRKAFDAGFNETSEETTPTEPKQKVLFSGDRTMPDGSTRVYADGKIVGISYPPGFPASQMQKLDKASLSNLNKQEGLYYVEVEPTPTTPTQPTDPATLKQGSVTMPDGSTRVYKNGLVVEVFYPPNMADLGNKNPAQINESEGIRGVNWIPEAPVVTPVEPVVDRDTLLQGRVTWSDRSTRTYIDGKVVSVQYPDGKTGPNIDEINAAEGVQPAKDPGARPKDWMDRFLEEQAQQQKAKNDAAAAAAAAAAAENPEPDTYVNPRGFHPSAPTAPQTPAPQTTAQSLNLAVAPARAPATTSMPEDTTPGIAN